MWGIGTFPDRPRSPITATSGPVSLPRGHERAGHRHRTRSRPHTTCGGRPLTDDIVDILYTVLVGGLDGPQITDGVDHPTQPPSRNFPYLVPPNPDPPDPMTIFAALSAPPEEAASSAR
jgi:hypothetical protein